jgi:hypothetical protein
LIVMLLFGRALRLLQVRWPIGQLPMSPRFYWLLSPTSL